MHLRGRVAEGDEDVSVMPQQIFVMDAPSKFSDAATGLYEGRAVRDGRLAEIDNDRVLTPPEKVRGCCFVILSSKCTQ